MIVSHTRMPSESDTLQRPNRAPSFVPPAASNLTADLPVDASGRLVPVRNIAVGGMGEVIEVEDLALRRHTAKKLLHTDLQGDLRSQRMFLREARITGQLEHPNVVPVHELGLDADGRLYFTMKRIEGQTLSAHVAALPAGPFDHRTLLNLVDVVIRVCDALSYAHARGVVHCDIKASNVMVGDHGQIYLVDWGVARVVDAIPVSGADGRVDDGLPPLAEDVPAISGTPTNMASEQARGELAEIDARTDVFAVGALLYEIVRGEPPYAAPNVMAALYKAAMGEREPLSACERGRMLPPELGRIIERAMSVAREARYPDIAAMREDLVRFVRGQAEFPTTTFPAGTTIIAEGERGDTAYRIVAGSCDVFLVRDGVRQLVRTMSEGEMFGEMAILSPGPRTATVIATTEVVAEVITAEVFEWELRSVRPWLATVIHTMANRFRERNL